MSTLERIVVLVNALEALAAAAVNVKAVRLLPRGGPLRRCFTAVAGLAFFYAAGYTWLFLTGQVLIWSSTLRGVSTIVWPVVWAWPAHEVAKFVSHTTEMAKREFGGEEC